MGGVASVIAPVVSAIGGGGVVSSIVGGLASTLLSSALAPDAPSASAPPPPPAVEPIPEAPKAEPEPAIKNEAVLDTEAAKIRNQKRRTQQKSSALFSLGDDITNVKSKSLLG